MKKLTTILAAILLCATCYAETKIAIRLATYYGEVYTIVFEYSDKPLAYPSNVPPLRREYLRLSRMEGKAKPCRGNFYGIFHGRGLLRGQPPRPYSDRSTLELEIT